MADPTIRLKRSNVAGKIPTPSNVPLGEIALNTKDGFLYASKDAVGIGTTVIAINPWRVGTGTDAYDAYFTQGNVGIGLTAPTSTLHVSGDGLFTSTLTATDSELYTEFDITNNGSSAYQFASTGIGFGGISGIASCVRYTEPSITDFGFEPKSSIDVHFTQRTFPPILPNTSLPPRVPSCT